MVKKIGFVGLGKLGLPVAMALANRGFLVKGYDINPDVLKKETSIDYEYWPNHISFQQALKETGEALSFANTLDDLVAWNPDMIYVAVQTPHEPKFDGTKLYDPNNEPQDFDYSFLKTACFDLSQAYNKADMMNIPTVIISTVLPGTVRKHILPLFKNPQAIVYNPFFIAMGTTVRDFLHPEFVLLGSDSQQYLDFVDSFYRDELRIGTHTRLMSIESAELTKVAYNTFIGLKLAFANTIQEISHKIPECDCDEVMNALKTATDRIISPAYLTPGMGDGGACHPRDNIALTNLADRLDMDFDLFGATMASREGHATFLCELVKEHCDKTGFDALVLGYAYKPDMPLTYGSPALLCVNILEDMDVDVDAIDPYHETHVCREHVAKADTNPHVFLIGCRHTEFKDYVFPKGSVVIDPWGYIPKRNGIEVIHVGRRSK